MGVDTDRIIAVMRGDTRGPRASAARAGLWVLSRVYALGIGVYYLLYRVGILKRVHLRPVVVSVGNITVGGTGKTTTIQYLGRLLSRAGRKTAVLSYGYRAGDKNAVNVVSDGQSVLMSAAEAGDEAVLLAGSLPGVPVLIGRRRVLSGAEADRRFSPDVLLCDDAFQYWRLHRDVDLVLVDAVEPWGFGHVLPRGLLREPKRQARRASAFLITHADLVSEARLARLRAELDGMGRPVWTARHAPSGLVDLNGVSVAPLSALDGMKVLAVSSLGDPGSFEATLAHAGAVVTPCRFADHHHFTEEEVAAVEQRAADEGLRIVSTAKDAVKLHGAARADRWWILDIALAVDGAADFDQWLISNIRKV